VVASARIPAPAACRATVNALIADLQPHELEVFIDFLLNSARINRNV